METQNKRLHFDMFIAMVRKYWLGALILLLTASCAWAQERGLAATPPMGWGSGYAYGLTINEAQFRDNMTILAAQLKEFGWQYVVLDAGWYLQNPEMAAMPERLRYTTNAQGQYEPAISRFPSARQGVGLKALSDAVHGNGLKFGIEIVRGIPKKTVLADTRIGLTRFHAARAADTSDRCPAKPENYAVRDNAAGQAWYDALMKQYASWGVDYLDVDCMARPYRPEETRMIHKAILRSGRAMVLSLSSGPVPLDQAGDVGKYAQLWRVSGEVWDRWDRRFDGEGAKAPAGDSSPNNSPQSTASQSTAYQTVKEQFAILASWAAYAKPGNWPDAGMLPIGQLRPAPGYGKPRASSLTEDEQRSMITLWAIARSPLMIGGNLTQMDEAMKSLLTDPGVIAVNQHSTGAHPVTSRYRNTLAWASQSTDGTTSYLAIFNPGDAPIHVDRTFAEYGFIDRAQYRARDLWMRKELGVLNAFTADIPAHGSVVFSLRE